MSRTSIPTAVLDLPDTWRGLSGSDGVALAARRSAS